MLKQSIIYPSHLRTKSLVSKSVLENIFEREYKWKLYLSLSKLVEINEISSNHGLEKNIYFQFKIAQLKYFKNLISTFLFSNDGKW